MKETAPSFLFKHIETINRLRWLFLFVFALTIWLVSHDMSQILSLIGPIALIAIASFFFNARYRRLQSGLNTLLPLEGLVFWQAILDIAMVTYGIGLTGGSVSLLPLIYVLYFGALELFFGPWLLFGLNLVAISAYIGIVYAQAWRWLIFQPSLLPETWQAVEYPYNPLMWFILLVLTLNTILVVTRSQYIRRKWLETELENAFLSRLNRLSHTAMTDFEDGIAFQQLANEIKTLTGADHVFISRWDDETEQVLPLAADSSIHERYLLMPPTPRYENTFTRSVKRAGKLIIAENIACSPYISARVASLFDTRSALAVPLYGAQDRFLGALVIAFRARHEFSEHEIARIHQVSDILSLLISRSWLYEEAMRRASLLEKMAGQVTNLVSDLKRTTLLPSIVESARSLLQAQRAALHLQQDDGSMECEYSVGLSEGFLEQLTNRFNQLAGGRLLQNREYLIIPDINQDSRTSPVQDLIFGEKFRAYAVFSLNPDTEQRGALSLYWDTPYVVSAEEISVGKLFAERASAIIRSARLYAQATEEALTDILTDLPNRRHLDQRIREEIERASRYEHTFALLMIDLDGFKGINDTFGHPIGDSVLKQVSIALRRTLRASDFLARYGGDEFSIILPETGVERALHVAEKLRLALTSTRLHLPQETQRYLSGCMGIAIYPLDKQTAEEMITCADQRMYRAKRCGAGSIIYKDD